MTGLYWFDMRQPESRSMNFLLSQHASTATAAACHTVRSLAGSPSVTQCSQHTAHRSCVMINLLQPKTSTFIMPDLRSL